MRNSRSLRVLDRLAGITVLFGLAAAPALAQEGDRPCNIASIAGNWAFATGVEQQRLVPGQEGDLASVGIANIDKSGNVSGTFDRVIFQFGAFLDNTYTGSITVGADCRGTLTFVAGDGQMRTDSVVVLSQDEMRGLSRDTSNLGIYQIRRISRAAGKDALAAKIDALLRRLGLVASAFENDD